MTYERLRNELRTLFARNNLSAWLALILGLLLTVSVWFGLNSQTLESAEQQFEFHVQDVVDSIEERMRQHEQILLGGAGLFEASQSVEREEWRTYVERLKLKDNYPGIQGVGYSQVIQPSTLQAHIATIRSKGFPDYTVRPAGTRDLYTSIIYLEPFAERNLAAFGFDMFSEATRAQAMRRAGETGETIISGKVKLVQENRGKVQAGFLMYVPIYRKNQALNTATDRWAALQGFVYSPYRMNDLMRGILQGERNLGVGFAIYDGKAVVGQALMYETDDAAASIAGTPTRRPWFSVTRAVAVYGQTWTVSIYSRPQFEAKFQSKLELIILLLGGITSLLLFVVAWVLNFRRERAQQLAQEMTRRIRHNEAALASSSARIQAILNTVVDGIITINDRGIVETLNPAAEHIFGYSADQVIGHNIKMLMPEPYHGAHDGYLSNYRSTGKRKIIGTGREVTGRRKDGSTFPMDLAVSEMAVRAEIKFTGIVRDITERKKVERMKNEFVSTVSHELRTPLTSIRGALGLLLGKHGSALPEKGRQLLEMANRNSERLTLLINDILDLEKIESGNLNFDLKALDLMVLAQRALAANEGYAHQYSVRLRLGEAPQGATVWGDDHRLMQVFSNLLSNAIKYSPSDGEVVISISRRNGRYRVSVQDRGRGIPPEFRSSIFQRFAQADSSDTREKGGTGLGLSVTKAIVERHGGTINYESEIGAGTEFYFELPAWEETVTVVHGKEGEPVLLVCEDNSDVAQVLRELLAREGLASDVAATAAGAKSLLAQRGYQALVLDLSLPDQDGLALIRELRAQEHTKDVPIIVVSGRASEGHAAWEGDALAVIDWLQKPVDKVRLAHALRQALAGNARPRVLHVEDDTDVIQVVQVLLEGTAEYAYATTLAEARRRLVGERFDLVLLDLMLADGSGLDLLKELDGKVPVVVFSGLEPDRTLSEQVAAALVKTRTSNEQLLETIKRTIHQKRIANHE